MKLVSTIRVSIARRVFAGMLRLTSLCLLLLMPVYGQAQNLAPLANPDLYLRASGFVRAVVLLPDGSLVFGGSFNEVDGKSRLNIAKLNPDGTLDPDWNPSANAAVWALATNSSGHVYVGGSFSNIGGQARRYIAKLSGSGSGAADPTWNPSANDEVRALATDTSGNVYVGGWFKNIGGQMRSYIAKLSDSGSGAAVRNWDPSADDGVEALAIDSDGNVYVGGDFLNIGDQARSYIAKLPGSGSGAADPAWNPSADAEVLALATDPAGNVYVGGLFTTIGGQARKFIAKLRGSGSGAADLTWNPSADDWVHALATDTSGRVYVGGAFSNIGAQTRVGCAIVTASGSVVGGANAVFPGKVYTVASQAAGGTIVGGRFVLANGLTRHNILRLKADGTLDPVWNPNPSADDEVLALATVPNGDVYVGGSFQNIGGQARSDIAKLSGSGVGAADPTWNPAANSSVLALAIDINGNVYAGGYFSNIGGQARKYIAKLPGSGSGAADAGWNPSADKWVNTLAIDASGDVFAGGGFLNIGGQSRRRIAKLSGSGGGAADAGWNPSADDSVLTLATDTSGNLYAGGRFKNIGAQMRNYIVKLSGSGRGAADAAWKPSADGYVNVLATDSSGHVYVGGDFLNIGGRGRRRIAKLSGNGSGVVDADWDPSADDKVSALATNSSGQVYVGGYFSNIGGQQRLLLAAFPGDANAPVNLIFHDGFEQ